MVRRQRDQSIALPSEKRITAEYDRIDPLLGKAREGSLEIGFAAGVCDVNLLRESASRCLRVSDLGLSGWACRVDEDADNGDFRQRRVAIPVVWQPATPE